MVQAGAEAEQGIADGDQGDTISRAGTVHSEMSVAVSLKKFVVKWRLREPLSKVVHANRKDTRWSSRVRLMAGLAVANVVFACTKSEYLQYMACLADYVSGTG